MRIAIIQFPGSNCERETSLAVRRAGMEPVSFLWNENPGQLEEMAGYIIVGGFSYEDRGRAGIVAAMHPIMQKIRRQSECGKPVLGICNGAQILLESGLVPGYQSYPVSMGLTDNKRISQGNVLGTGFYNAWVNLAAASQSRRHAFNQVKPPQPMRVPMAHAQGRFVMDEAILADIDRQGLIAWQYCDDQGQLNPEFPSNPNGSVANIAAIVNHGGNVMAMMPHPERTSAGDSIFQSMRAYIASGYSAISPVAAPAMVSSTCRPYPANPEAHTFLVDQVIQDNAAYTINRLVQTQLGLPVSLKRRQFWSVACHSRSVLHQVQASGVLFNPQKEFMTQYEPDSTHTALLVCAKEDCLGQQKKQQLNHHVGIEGIHSIEHGVLWIIEAESDKLNQVADSLNRAHILNNPISHVCYVYE